MTSGLALVFCLLGSCVLPGAAGAAGCGDTEGVGLSEFSAVEVLQFGMLVN